MLKLQTQSKLGKSTDSIYKHASGTKLTIPADTYATVFQAGMYHATKACAYSINTKAESSTAMILATKI